MSSVQQISFTPQLDKVILPSKIDASVNFITEGDFPGLIESRYVRRLDDYLIAYLSCQTGCAKACRFCHLTQSGQTKFANVETKGIIDQAEGVLKHYDTTLKDGAPAATSVHFNFMARGEPFASTSVLTDGEALMRGLSSVALSRGLAPRVKISSIFPTELANVTDVASLFGGYAPDLYYSFYSTNESFRRRWMPKALPYTVALEKLARYQEVTRKIPVIHGAFIKGENDSEENVESMCEAINAVGLRVDVNIVRYNPFSSKQGEEPTKEVLVRNANLFEALLPGARVKVVTRVGFDVAASCGMFVAKAEDL